MTAREIWPEIHAAARNLGPDHLTRLEITPDNAIAAGGLGTAEIAPHSAGLFEFGGDLGAMIVPVYWGPLPSPDAPIPDSELIDLAAFDLSNPEQVWLRRGDGVFLNAGALDDLWLEAPLRIHRTPLDWLRAGATGCVVLDWQLATVKLSAIATLTTDDPDFGREIRRRLQKPVRIPEIRIITDTHSRAA